MHFGNEQVRVLDSICEKYDTRDLRYFSMIYDTALNRVSIRARFMEPVNKRNGGESQYHVEERNQNPSGNGI